ncbi:maleylpyruvate isomerase family mycothiol-dependent enzyme [Acrocarpospora catenulata]|uniref:maleylpyruvate isomerase family mycothiol-dependent enzyme n=1 Tax=Acrocarpospora catenulata TaxID=2836182 RepID=UPI001BDAF4CF|nr:maleylpyruvate isomerase family mycothiol-dependent enzyme [Acrocarpospora catenulata]
MAEPADQTIKALRAEFEELAALVRGFGEDELARRSGAVEWDVSQVLSHLGSGAEIGLAALNGAVDGSGAPEREFIQGVWARWDAMSRAQRAEEFLSANDAQLRRFEDLDAQAREELRIPVWWPGDPADVATFGGMRLNELALHAWDVKVAFDGAATLTPEVAELLLPRAEAAIAWVGKAAGLGGRQASVAVHLTAPEQSFGVEIRDAVSITEVPSTPDGVLTAPAEWWVRLASGRHSPEHTPAGVEFTGETLTLDDLRRVFPGY